MRVLIATVTAGGGHLAAAGALEQAWRGERPGDQTQQVDLLTFFSRLHGKVYADGYLRMAGKAPEVWGLLFGRTDDPAVARKLTRAKRLLPSASRNRFIRFLKDFNPDVVLCTHYLPLEGLSFIRSSDRKGDRSGSTVSDPVPKPMVVSIVTDFEAHALWMDPCVDLYCVAAEETRVRLVARGAAPEMVVPTGIPISARFTAPVDKMAVRRRLGLRDDLALILVLSGGFGMGPVSEILSGVDAADTEFQTVVVTGKNTDLRRDLAIQDRKHPTHILGFASNMNELMAVADLIVTKPGGLTSSEALAQGKPMLIVHPIPGQEAANSDYLLEKGAAIKANRVEDLRSRVEGLIGSRKLGEMARAARKLGRPEAAVAICREVQQRMAEREGRRLARS